MFSQLINAVEGFAQPQPPRSPSQDVSANRQLDGVSRSLSMDNQNVRELTSTNHLADSALSNLRKTIVSQRSGSPRPSSPSSTSAQSLDRPSKRRLEDRLRAKLTHADAS